MIFTYEFENNIFEYEPDIDDAINYIIKNYSNDDILKAYIDTLYEKESKNNKEILKSYDGFDGTYESLDNMSEEIKEDLVNEIIYDLIKTDIYRDALEDYFEQEAYDAYEEDKAERDLRRSSYRW